MTSNRHRNATQRCKVIVNNQNEHKEIQKRGRKKPQQRDVKQQKWDKKYKDIQNCLITLTK